MSDIWMKIKRIKNVNNNALHVIAIMLDQTTKISLEWIKGFRRIHFNYWPFHIQNSLSAFSSLENLFDGRNIQINLNLLVVRIARRIELKEFFFGILKHRDIDLVITVKLCMHCSSIANKFSHIFKYHHHHWLNSEQWLRS